MEDDCSENHDGFENELTWKMDVNDQGQWKKTALRITMVVRMNRLASK